LSGFAELYEKKIRVDDNFSIPLITGICLLLLNNW
jgi:dolichol kinase